MTHEGPAFETDHGFCVPENQDNNTVPVETADEVIVLQDGQMMFAFRDIIDSDYTNRTLPGTAHRLELTEEEHHILDLTYRSSSGDMNAFWMLFRHYAPLMQGSVHKVLDGEFEAVKDVIHNVGQQMAALVERNQFLNQTGRAITHTSFRNYLSWAVRTQALKYMKESGSKRSIDTLDEEYWWHAIGSPALPLNVEDVVMSRIMLSEAVLLLREAFNKLSPTRRKILTRRYWEGWTDEQIGRELDMTGHHVNVDLRRALRQLRKSKELVNVLKWLYGRGEDMD